MRRVSLYLGLAVIGLSVTAMAADQGDSAGPPPDEEIKLLHPGFSFEGPFGTYDRAALQRGLQVYTEVCSACHGLYELSYRNLKALGYSDDQVKAYAADHDVADIADDGTPTTRKAKPFDPFVRPFPNEKAARNANNGALPPDLALIEKARKGGADYVYSLLQGFRDPPPDVKMMSGMNYNIYFHGHQIAMAQPLQPGQITFADGAPNDLPSEAHDIATFLNWAANPEMEERKEMGVYVVIYLAVTAVFLYLAKLWIWRNVH